MWATRNRGSIRFRITALATLVVAFVLIAAAVTLVMVQRSQLTSNLDASLGQRADTYESSFVAGEGLTFLNSNDEDRAAQLIGVDGSLLASTSNVRSSGPMIDISSTPSGDDFVSRRVESLEDDSYRILSRPVDGPTGPAVLVVAQNADDVNDAVRGLGLALAVTVPGVVAFLAGLVWWLVGRTLQPVESIRAEVATITGTDGMRRVPVPDQADEIARLATTMNEMLDRIDTSTARQRQFVADASHELRTPLTRIRTEVEVDLHQPGDADPAATNAAVLEEIIGLQRLLDNLLYLARSDEGQAPQHLTPTDLDDIVLREVEAARADSPEVEIDISAVSAAHIAADADQLRRLVRNLLSNAVRHAERTVSVSLSEDRTEGVPAMITLTVADDGPGVSPDARMKIFERFGRADDARTRHDGGAGLGLAIAKDIALRHDGTIRYDDTWSPGARFVVQLPATLVM